MKKTILCTLLCIGLLTACVSPDAKAKAKGAIPMSGQSFLLDTLVNIAIYDNDDQSLLQDVFDEISRLDSILSVAAPGGDPAKLAENAGKGYAVLSDDAILLLNESIRFSVLSGGAFDCTVEPLVSLWGIKDGEGHYPSGEEVAKALSLVDYQKIRIEEGNRAMLAQAGMEVDFGAIAKGYIADRVKMMLIDRGVSSALIDLGGDIALLGSKPDDSCFRIGLRDPGGGANDILGIFEVADMCLASSGSYERFFIHEGKAYHHILDVGTGFPADNELLQVTILSNSTTGSEGYSTTAFLLGLARGLALVESADGVEAVFVTKDNRVYVTDGIKDRFRLTATAYALANRENEPTRR
ncbi:MAG: FAD:protein FMN transferase [Clostridiales bacterium]|nr:FAD:protein FMN transferase [Clostridiales bacterium]